MGLKGLLKNVKFTVASPDRLTKTRKPLIWIFKNWYLWVTSLYVSGWSTVLKHDSTGTKTHKAPSRKILKLTLGLKFEIEQFVYQQKWLSQHHVRNIELEAGWCNSKQQLRMRTRIYMKTWWCNCETHWWQIA